MTVMALKYNYYGNFEFTQSNVCPVFKNLANSYVPLYNKRNPANGKQ